MKVKKFENKLYDSGLSLQGTSQVQVLEVLAVYIKPRKCKEWFWNVRFSSGKLIERPVGLCECGLLQVLEHEVKIWKVSREEGTGLLW